MVEVHVHLAWHDLQHKVHTMQHMGSAPNCAGHVAFPLVQQELVGL